MIPNDKVELLQGSLELLQLSWDVQCKIAYHAYCISILHCVHLQIVECDAVHMNVSRMGPTTLHTISRGTQ